MATGLARAAAAAGSEVQIVGKVGEDLGGDAILLDLAAGNVGHVAILRDPSRPTPATGPAPVDERAFDDDDDDDGDRPNTGDGDPMTTESGLSLEAADIELALRYLPDYRVLVVADWLAESSLRVAVAAASWNGAALVVIVPADGAHPAAGDDATVIEAPPDDPDNAFAGIVGAYAAAIDRGEEPKEAFASASSTLGWSAVAD
jgi:hypothetical protein